MAVKKEATVYVANTSGSAEIKGEVYTFNQGVTRVRAGHALAKTPFFDPVDDQAVHYDLEKPARKRRAAKPKTATKAAAPTPTPTTPTPEPPKPSGLSLSSFGSRKDG